MDPAASIVDVEVDGDSDLVVAGQDYNKISRTLTKVKLLSVASCAISHIDYSKVMTAVARVHVYY